MTRSMHRPRGTGGLLLALLLGGCQLGTSPSRGGTTTPQSRPAATPASSPAARPAAVDPIVQLASRSLHTCARRQSGSVLCWGRNDFGQLGDGRQRDSARLVKVTGLVDATAVATGHDFTCALRKAGSVVCWGNNFDGQLGDGRGANSREVMSLRATRVTGLQEAVALGTGEHHACALERGGTVECWGNGDDGQIGSDAKRAFGAPLPIDQLGPVAELAVGWSHVCVRETAGQIKCWGRNTEGQLGDGKSGSRIKPVTVATVRDAVEVVSGHDHSCARTQAGRVWCWGDNEAGQLGPLARGKNKSNTPVEVRDLGAVVQLAAGKDHSCARQSSGRVVCWGSNAAGQLGPGVAAGAQRAGAPGIDDAIDLALGARHTCVLRKGGEVTCWGDGQGGTLGPYRSI